MTTGVPLASLAFAAATLYIYVPLTWIYSTLLFWGKTFTLGPVSFAVNLTEAIIFFAIGLVCLWSVAWLVRAFGRLQCDLTRKFFAAPPSMAMVRTSILPLQRCSSLVFSLLLRSLHNSTRSNPSLKFQLPRRRRRRRRRCPPPAPLPSNCRLVPQHRRLRSWRKRRRNPLMSR
jgi:hypothetical protein